MRCYCGVVACPAAPRSQLCCITGVEKAGLYSTGVAVVVETLSTVEVADSEDIPDSGSGPVGTGSVWAGSVDEAVAVSTGRRDGAGVVLVASSVVAVSDSGAGDRLVVPIGVGDGSICSVHNRIAVKIKVAEEIDAHFSRGLVYRPSRRSSVALREGGAGLLINAEGVGGPGNGGKGLSTSGLDIKYDIAVH